MAGSAAQVAASPRELVDTAGVRTLGHPGRWSVLRSAIGRQAIVQQSSVLLAASTKLPPEELEYGGVAWRASRNYLNEDDQELLRELPLTELLEGEAEELLQAAAFAPLVEAVVAAAQCHCGRRLKLDSAFSTLYAGEAKGMADHRDYDSKNEIVPVSAILQCHTDAGFEGGGLWMRPAEKTAVAYRSEDEDERSPLLQDADGRVLVELAAGDLLLLEGAWHQPRDISGADSERLVLVCFFNLMVLEAEPEPEPESRSPAAPVVVEIPK